MSSSSKRVLRGKIEGIDQCSKKKSVDGLTVGKNPIRAKTVMVEATGQMGLQRSCKSTHSDEQGEEMSAGHAVGGKCMLAVAKGRERVRAQW